MEKALLVGLGGLIGSIGRYAVSGGVHRFLAATGFPYGTLAVNVLGCLGIGLLGGLGDVRGVFSPETRAFLFLGLVGGFTTFSTFAYETLAFARDGESLKVAVNVLLQVLGCLVAVWFGDALARAIWGGGV